MDDFGDKTGQDVVKFSPEDIRKFTGMVNDPKFHVELSKVERWDLLPGLFKVHGTPFSIDDRPQFRPMFAKELTQNTIIISGRQVGKSMSLSRSEILLLLQVPYFQTLYVAPLKDQAMRYANDYIVEAIRSCPLAAKLQDKALEGKSDTTIKRSQSWQSFANGSGIQIVYAKNGVDRARGIHADCIDFDELQDQFEENIPIITQSLKNSTFGCTRFTGTAKSMGNTIQTQFERSSMSEWVMKCDHCGKWNIPTLEYGLLDKMIKPEGLMCAHCGKQLDVRKGGWVPARKDRVSTFPGYHIPQVVVPFIAMNPNNWQKVMRDLLDYSLMTFIQENLGISVATGQKLITQKDIDARSVLPDAGQMYNEIKEGKRRYDFYVMGVDWGGAEQQSFTVAVVLGVKSDPLIGHRTDVLYAERFEGLEPDVVYSSIASTYRKYGCSLCAVDYGLGFDRNVVLSHQFGLAIAQIQLTRQKRLFALDTTDNKGERSPDWTVDKFTALNTMFYAIKYGSILFPKVAFSQFTVDLLSPYEETHEANGTTTKFYQRTPGKPDDFAMALCFGAIVGARLRGMMIDGIIPAWAFKNEDFNPVSTGRG